jgi:hypothetical protein
VLLSLGELVGEKSEFGLVSKVSKIMPRCLKDGGRITTTVLYSVLRY